MDLVMEDSMDCFPTRSKGLTLVELVITLAIVGILTSLAVPAFSGIRAKNAMAASVNLFLTQLHLARSTAVTRERRITLCPASNRNECNNDHRAWKNGYLIFQDDNKNRKRDPGEQIISYEEKANAAVKIVSSSRFRNRISFLALGRAWFSNTTVRFCHAEYPELNRAIIVSNNGRVRTRKKMADGSAVTCS